MRIARRSIIALVVVLVGARLALPYVLHAYLNRVLASHPRYGGTVGDVDVGLYRGAYSIHDVELHKREGRVPVPFLKAPSIDVSIEWRAILDGSFVSEVFFDRPELNFVAGPTRADRQSGVEGQWKELVEKLAPTKFNRVEVRGGNLRFRNFHSDPKVDVSLHHLDLVAENLANTRDAAERRPARLEVRGDFEGSRGQLVMHVELDADAELPSFDADLVVKDADLPAWNDFLRAYANLDVQKGRLSLYAELLADQGAFRGYAKPFFQEVEVLGWTDEARRQSLLSTAWEAVVESLFEVFRNREADDVATRIPITGTVEGPEARFWPALGNVLYNAFIDGLAPQLEHSVGKS